MRPYSELQIDAFAGTIDRVFVSGKVRKNIGSRSGEGHLHIKIAGKLMQVHRLIYAHFHGPIPPWLEVDHVNGIRDDNRIENLRLVSKAGNMQNQRKAQLKNSSGLLGVYLKEESQKWVASITYDGNRRYLGSFPCKNEAHAAYLEAKRELHATCTI